MPDNSASYIGHGLYLKHILCSFGIVIILGFQIQYIIFPLISLVSLLKAFRTSFELWAKVKQRPRSQRNDSHTKGSVQTV